MGTKHNFPRTGILNVDIRNGDSEQKLLTLDTYQLTYPTVLNERRNFCIVRYAAPDCTELVNLALLLLHPNESRGGDVKVVVEQTSENDEGSDSISSLENIDELSVLETQAFAEILNDEALSKEEDIDDLEMTRNEMKYVDEEVFGVEEVFGWGVN
ncbi:Uncharacterized protein Fot_52198 [Forsythia ovata]|uniref:Uncharacterized protein n=1 Tax=Forsythia ovata TaxID=205694 RepID=A0ABD1PKQ1_9LAMI